MLVSRWMSKDVITIDKRAVISDAIELMRSNKVRFLPVMGKDELVGVLSDGDIDKASAPSATRLEIHKMLYQKSRIKVAEIMTAPAITVSLNHTVEEAANVLLQNRISGAPVIDHHRALRGVITRSDIFRVLIALTAHSKKGIQIGLLARDRRGLFKAVADIVRRYNGCFLNVLTSREAVPEGYRELFIRIHDMDSKQLGRLLAHLATETKLLFWIDHRTGRREIFDLK